MTETPIFAKFGGSDLALLPALANRQGLIAGETGDRPRFRYPIVDSAKVAERKRGLSPVS